MAHFVGVVVREPKPVKVSYEQGIFCGWVVGWVSGGGVGADSQADAGDAFPFWV